MAEPIDELKRRIIKSKIQSADFEHANDEGKSIGEFKGRKMEHIDPKNSKTRSLFKKNIQNS